VFLLNTGDGPLRGIVGISSGRGEVRGYVGSPMLGDMELTEAVGKGSVQIVKNHPEWTNPYNGITSIRHGDIDRDIGKGLHVNRIQVPKDCGGSCYFLFLLGIYLAESEQRSCALAASTSINGILCTASGGYLIEQLPGAVPETLKRVEENLAILVEKDGSGSLPTGLLLNGVTPLEIAEMILDGLDMQPLQQIKPSFSCECTEDRLVRALRLLPRSDIDEILSNEEKVEARCEFCGKVYRMGPDEVLAKLESFEGDPAKDSDFEKNLKDNN
jgi:molecular chaperone Hsp33